SASRPPSLGGDHGPEPEPALEEHERRIGRESRDRGETDGRGRGRNQEYNRIGGRFRPREAARRRRHAKLRTAAGDAIRGRGRRRNRGGLLARTWYWSQSLVGTIHGKGVLGS